MDRDGLLHSLATRVSDERVLAAMAAVPRELFVMPQYAAAAYEDAPLRIGLGQTISQPTVVARMAELLELHPMDRVLDVGTGSGYHAAVLSRLCEHVWGVELHEQLALRAARTLDARGHRQRHRPRPATALRGCPSTPRSTRSTSPRRRAGRSRRRSSSSSRSAAGSSRRSPTTAGEQLVLVRRHEGGFERRRLESVRFVPLR